MPEADAAPPKVDLWGVLRQWLTPEGANALAGVVLALVSVIGALITYVRTSSFGWTILLGLGVGSLAAAASLAGIRVLVRRADQERRRQRPPRPAPPLAGEPIGRDQEISSIQELLTTAAVVSVHGRRGIGTSTCARVAVHRMVEAEEVPARLRRMARRSLFLDLRPDNTAWSGTKVVTELGELLGLPVSERQPAAVCGRLADERRLLVLDNVDHPSQVEDLLPGAGQAFKVLVAGTFPIPAAELVPVGRLAEDDAALLVWSAATGEDRLPDETSRRESLSALAELCGYQPQLLSAAGEGIRTRLYDDAGLARLIRRVVAAPPYTASPEVTALAQVRLQSLADQDIAYADLSGNAIRFLRRLALVPAVVETPPGPGGRRRLQLYRLGPEAMARMAGVTYRSVLSMLNDLARAGFLSEPGERRSIQPLDAPMARVHLLRDESRWARAHAYTELLKHLAKQAERHTEPNVANWSWFEQNHLLLRAEVLSASAAGQGTAEPLPRGARRWWLRLAVALCVWYAAEGRLDDWRTVCEAVRGGPRRRPRQLLPSAALETTWVSNELAAISRRQVEDPGRTVDLLRAALERAKARPWSHLGEAQIRTNLALSLGEQAQHRRDQRRPEATEVRPLLAEALEQLEEARGLRARTDKIGQALTDLAAGVVFHQLARSDAELAGSAEDEAVKPPVDRDDHLAMARRRLAEATGAFRDAGELRGETAALTNLVLVAGEMRTTGIALKHGELALRRYADRQRQIDRDDDSGRAAAYLNMGAVLLASDGPDLEQARTHLEEGRDLRGEGSSRGLGRTLLYLGDAEHDEGRPSHARNLWHQAEQMFADANDRDGSEAVDRRLTDTTPE
jgi:hypothetical protein